MKMDHVAIVTKDAEKMKDFYVECFGAKRVKKWGDGKVCLYFIEFDNGVQIELEQREDPARYDIDRENGFGIAHLCFQVDTKAELEQITAELAAKGIPMRSGPTAYGEDFYESSFWDPDGNVVEISVDTDYLEACKVAGIPAK